MRAGPVRATRERQSNLYQTHVIVGYPAEKYKVTQGTVVQSIGGSGKNFFLKVDAPKGSSGGAVIDRDGQVIGIVSSGDDFHTYAIPANVLKVLLDKPDTIESLGQWHNRDSIRAYAYFVQSEIKNYAGNYKAEIVDLDKAVQLNAALILPYIHRGIAKRNLGDAESTHGNLEEARRLYKAAIEDYTQAITLDPEFFFAYNNRGNAKHALGRYKAAVEDYTQAITLDPKYISAYNNRGYAKFRLAESAAARENTGKAQRLYEAAIEDYTQAIIVESIISYTVL